MAISASTTVSLHGTLIHPDGEPISKRTVRLVPKSDWFFCLSQSIPETKTDRKGRFTFTLPKMTIEEEIKATRAYIEVFEHKTAREGEGERKIASIPISYTHDCPSDLLKLVVELYDFEDDLPIQKQPSNLDYTPQQATLGFKLNLLKNSLFPKSTALIAKAIGLTTEQIQDLYPDNGKELSSEQVIDLILNGVNPVLLKRGSNNTFEHEITWAGVGRDEGADLFDAKIVLINEKDSFSIKKLTIAYPGEKPVTKTPESPDFLRFLQLFASMGIIEGEIKEHLGKGHIYVGFVSLGFFDCISTENPLYQLLSPHLEGVQPINHLGAGLIFGPSGVLNVSGVSPEGINQCLKKTISEMD
ncbi:MAG: hypothetical protein ACK5MA_01015 [Parachlamydiaceae bacterium]